MQFTVPPHREQEGVHACPNCGAMVKPRMSEMTQVTEKKSPKDITSLSIQTQRVKLPEHRITPAECEVIKEISRRGSGIAYLARHPEVEGYLLIKAFLPEYTVSEDVTGRWTRVSRMAED